jgi:hypothetical protein
MKRLAWCVALMVFILAAEFSTVLIVGGCAGGVPKIPVAVEVCLVDPEYGKICGSYVDGKFKISADVTLPEEIRSKYEDKIKALGSR